MADYYISHSAADREWAKWIASQLRSHGHSVNLMEDLRAGDSWQSMDAEIKASDRVILLLSPSYLDSRFAMQELKVATEARGDRPRILPIRVRECSIPETLANTRYLDLAGMERPHAEAFLRQELLQVVVGISTGARVDPVDRVLSKKGEKKIEAERDDGNIRFSAYYPNSVTLAESFKLLAYMYVERAVGRVIEDARAQLGSDRYSSSESTPTTAIARGAAVTVVPNLPGFQSEPGAITFEWRNDWHRADFTITPNNVSAGTTLGEVRFYVGPVLVGAVHIEVKVAAGSAVQNHPVANSAAAYQSIFVSYSHKDREIVDGLKKAYDVLGMTYLRDVENLRSGQRFSKELCKLIEQADIFQLCWSTHSKKSRFVEDEWRHALKQQREAFIRPVYWQEPMPQRPTELDELTFAYLEVPRKGLRGIAQRLLSWISNS